MVPEVTGGLVEVLALTVGLVREADRGVAVGRGYVPVEEGAGESRRGFQVRRDVGRGRRVPRGRVWAHWAGECRADERF